MLLGLLPFVFVSLSAEYSFSGSVLSYFVLHCQLQQSNDVLGLSVVFRPCLSTVSAALRFQFTFVY